MSRKAFFFDRDGVVNASPGEGRYVLRWEDFQFLPGLSAVLTTLKARGWLTLLVTNQQCVGKRLLSREALDALHDRMQAELGPLRFDGIFLCPHLAEENCACRKPKPGLAARAAQEFGLDLAACWLVGDHDRDIQLARNAGIGTAVRFVSEKKVGEPADYLVHSHAELQKLLS